MNTVVEKAFIPVSILSIFLSGIIWSVFSQAAPPPYQGVTAEGNYIGLEYHGFDIVDDDPVRMAMRQKGLENIFTGKGFRLAFPLESVAAIESAKQLNDKITSLSAGISDSIFSATWQQRKPFRPFNSEVKRFQLYGRLPSPANRPPVYNDEGQPLAKPDLTTSIIKRNEGFYKNNNCFFCHSGVSAGIVSAGQPNAHVDQSGYAAELTFLISFATLLKRHLNLLQLVSFNTIARARFNNKLLELTYVFDDLKADERPTIWSRTNTDPFAYDLEKVGLLYQEKDISPENYARWKTAAKDNPRSEEAREFRRWYNTSGMGRSNQGHDWFSTIMDNDEIYAVVEFLKSLSGPTMKNGMPKPKRYYQLEQ